MERWTFGQGADGRWCWCLTLDEGRYMRTPAETFATRGEAVADAMRHGYLKRPIKPLFGPHVAGRPDTARYTR
jgi:hypothetical protein